MDQRCGFLLCLFSLFSMLYLSLLFSLVLIPNWLVLFLLFHRPFTALAEGQSNAGHFFGFGIDWLYGIGILIEYISIWRLLLLLIKLLDYLYLAFSAVVLEIDFLFDLRFWLILRFRCCFYHLIFHIHCHGISLCMSWLGRRGRFGEGDGVGVRGGGMGGKLERKYLNQILKDMSHGIVEVPDLPYDILGCFLADLLGNLDVHVAVDEVVGVDLRVGVRLGFGGVLDHAFNSRAD